MGGILPQQPGILEVIDRARADRKYVAVGQADPTSQPEIYSAADARVLGEGEKAIQEAYSLRPTGHRLPTRRCLDSI